MFEQQSEYSGKTEEFRRKLIEQEKVFGGRKKIEAYIKRLSEAAGGKTDDPISILKCSGGEVVTILPCNGITSTFHGALEDHIKGKSSAITEQKSKIFKK